MAKPLERVRVLELCTMITGPLTGMMLGDLGAEVIKIESPEGDPFRKHAGTRYGAYFCTYNRNKQSIVLDLKSRPGHAALQALSQSADILIENFRPGVMERLRLDFETLRQSNPRLIYCSITGFGETGPYALRPAYDAVAQAQSGSMSLFLDADHPDPVGPTLSDNLAGVYACYGVLGALYERERTGVGRRVDVNMIESTMAFFASAFAIYKMEGVVQRPDTRVSTSQSYVLKSIEGDLIAIHLSSAQKNWESLLEIVGNPRLRSDARFRTYQDRIRHYHEAAQELRDAARQIPTRALADQLEAKGVPFAPVKSIPDVYQDPQVTHLQSFFEVTHPTAGTVYGVRVPVHYDGSRNETIAPPPALGEHTERILREANCNPDDIRIICAAKS